MKKNDNLLEDKHVQAYLEQYIESSQDAKNHEYNGISNDTRSLSRGEIFVAHRGEVTDGHLFVNQAIQIANSFAIVERFLPHIPLWRQLPVKSSIQALRLLAQAVLDRLDNHKVMYTGSSGKTTAKMMLAHMIKACKYKVYASVKSFNTLNFGVPMSIISSDEKVDVLVLEAGMSEPGTIRKISEFVKPEVGVITSIQRAHIAAFDSTSEIAEEKADLLNYVSKLAVVPNSEFTPIFKKHTPKGIDIRTFGEAADSNARLIKHELKNNKAHCACSVNDKVVSFTLNHPAKVAALSVLAGLLVIDYLGYDVEKAAASMSSFESVTGRGVLMPIKVLDKSMLLYDETFNANPDAMKEALNAFNDLKASYKVVLLGQMNELGKLSADIHMEIYDHIKEYKFIGLFGERWKSVYERLIEQKHNNPTQIDQVIFYSTDMREFKRDLHKHLQYLPEHTAFFIKGSRHGVRMEQIIEFLKGVDMVAYIDDCNIDNMY